MGYEAQNALEWASPEEREAHDREQEEIAEKRRREQTQQRQAQQQGPRPGDQHIQRSQPQQSYASAAGLRQPSASRGPLVNVPQNSAGPAPVFSPPPSGLNYANAAGARPGATQGGPTQNNQGAVYQQYGALPHRGPPAPSGDGSVPLRQPNFQTAARTNPQDVSLDQRSQRLAPSLSMQNNRQANAAARRPHGLNRPGPPRSNNGSGKVHERHFARVRPENDNFGKDYDKRRKEEYKKFAQIKQTAASDDEFGHRGVFILSDDVAAKPEAIVRSLKELTENRKCNIRHSRENPEIEVIAPEVQTIQIALSRARGMVASSASADDQLQMILIDSPADGMILDRTELRMVSACDKDAQPRAAGLEHPKDRYKMFPVLFPVSRDMVDLADGKENRRRNALALQVATAKALGRLARHRGSITMRLNFGALAFSRYQWPEGDTRQATAKFIENLRKPATMVSLYKLSPESLFFRRVSQAGALLVGYGGDDVKLTKPSFTGLFIWLKGDKADRIFEVTTDPIGHDVNDAPAVRQRGWKPPNAPGTTNDMSVYLSQLNCGISAALQIHTEPEFVQPKDYPKALTAQAMRILDSKDYVKSAARGELMFNWRDSGCEDFRQRTVWKYRVKPCPSYILEMIRYDSYERNSADLNRRPKETRWDATVYHEDWDSKVASNITMRPGEKANWETPIESFFPADGVEYEHGSGVSPGLATLMKWLYDFLDLLNVDERAAVWEGGPGYIAQ